MTRSWTPAFRSSQEPFLACLNTRGVALFGTLVILEVLLRQEHDTRRKPGTTHEGRRISAVSCNQVTKLAPRFASLATFSPVTSSYEILRSLTSGAQSARP